MKWCLIIQLNCRVCAIHSCYLIDKPSVENEWQQTDSSLCAFITLSFHVRAKVNHIFTVITALQKSKMEDACCCKPTGVKRKYHTKWWLLTLCSLHWLNVHFYTMYQLLHIGLLQNDHFHQISLNILYKDLNEWKLSQNSWHKDQSLLN